MKKNKNSKQIVRLLQIQLLLILSITVLTKIFLSNKTAISVLLGGLVAYLPIVIFTKKVFAVQGARAARQIVKNFYVGEFLKIITSVGLFVVVFVIYPIEPLAFFLTYITVVMSHWIAPLIIDNKPSRPENN